jgi:Ca2+-binding EF-hand superfamily protein
MGNKAGSANAKHPTKLTKKDYDFLIHATGQQKAQIDAVFNEFNANNPDGKLDKNEFIRLYDKLRPEPPELLDEISTFVFRTFDKDHNGFITFHEFMVAYSLTTRG